MLVFDLERKYVNRDGVAAAALAPAVVGQEAGQGDGAGAEEASVVSNSVQGDQSHRFLYSVDISFTCSPSMLGQ